MKPVGIMAAVVGCLMFLFGLVRFNSAESQLIRAFGGSDGLGMTLLVGGILFSIGGALTALFASSSPSYSPSNSSNAVPNTADLKKCPKCAELIKREASVCKHCGSEVSSSEQVLVNRNVCPKCNKDYSVYVVNCSDCNIPLTKSNTESTDKHIEKSYTKKCPKCAELIKLDAAVCKYCGNDVSEITKKSLVDRNVCPKCQRDFSKYVMSCGDCDIPLVSSDSL